MTAGDMPRRRVAALFVVKNGHYFNLPDVDPWDAARDARGYAGLDPVVAHPPCARWCRFAAFVERRHGLKRGDDGGMFAHALASVRRCGGVLEHPAWSSAWPAHGIATPPRGGGWIRADEHEGWTCHVEQRNYGHRARKATWLYAAHTARPELRWGPGAPPDAWRGGGRTGRYRRGFRGVEAMSKRERSLTPPEFRDLLLSVARTASPPASP